jgi:plastocyanin
MRRSIFAVAAAIILATATGCGGGSSSPSTPTSPTTPPPTGGNPTTATITIGADGRVSPSSVTVAPGGRVTFVNNHTAAHEMASNPHPEHTACPEINQVGFLQPGQQRTTGNLNTQRTCGFHDHNQPTNSGLAGTIVIQ